MTETTETTKPTRAPKIAQNGVTRPGAGTATARIWEIADAESARLGAPVERAAVLEIAEKEQLNPATAATQYGRWRTFNGLVRMPKPVTGPVEKPAKAEKPKKGAAPAAKVE